ncbi:cysteine-rich repeat secretory protein 38-like [Rhododendron vialii]|uniref:cysteine-rich repeat secretory protein 38-like n=1 Tax=Rhododendron vialii TaxID=182163 RepID=UPI00265FFD1B|nr:cysteine-rich repeat secretory protein 38-like [Rhododendron vialii]
MNICDPSPTYNPNGTFSTTLATAFATLQTTTAATGFSTTTITNPTTNTSVTALALCRCNLPTPDCQACVVAASLGIRSVCPNNMAAEVWYTNCTLRYSPINFLNQSDTSIAFQLWDARYAPNNSSFDPKVNLLLENLSHTAGASDKRSAVGRTTLVGSQNIYGYVDCTRDIDGGDCTTCLLDVINFIPSSGCLGHWAGWIATPTCNIQFDMDPVHEDWADNPPYINTDSLVGPGLFSPSDKGGLGGSGGGGKEWIVVVGEGWWCHLPE